MIQWKDDLIRCDNSSHYQKISDEYVQINMSNLEMNSICSTLIDNLKTSINLNNPSSILENLQNFNEFIEIHRFIEDFSVIMIDIQNLLSYPGHEIQKQISECIVQLISNDNSIGFFFIDHNIIEIIRLEIDRQNDLIFDFFPLIRILSSFNKEIFQKIKEIIPLSSLDICFEKKELNIETSLFLLIISNYDQNESVQTFILTKIQKIFQSGSEDYFVYLAHCLYQLSNSSTFCFDLFQSLNLNEFVDVSLKKSKLHCVTPICLFLSNLFKKNFIKSISKQNLQRVVNYSWNFDRPKRCEASIELLINVLDFGDVTNTSIILSVDPIGSTFIEIFRDEELPFSVKYKIIQFLLSFASKISLEDFTQLIAFDFFKIIDFVLDFSDDELFQKCFKLIVDSFQFSVAAKTDMFLVSCLKKSVDFDSIKPEQIYENESMNSFLALLHNIIDNGCI